MPDKKREFPDEIIQWDFMKRLKYIRELKKKLVSYCKCHTLFEFINLMLFHSIFTKSHLLKIQIHSLHKQ